MNILVDSSAWIEYFRGNLDYAFLTDLINADATRNKHFEAMAAYTPWKYTHSAVNARFVIPPKPW